MANREWRLSVPGRTRRSGLTERPLLGYYALMRQARIRSPLVAVGLVLCLLCAGRCARAASARASRLGGNAVLVVREFVSRFGSRPGSSLAQLFTEDARVRIDGLSVVVSGRQEIARLADYGVSVRSRMNLLDWTADSTTVSCRLVERNEWLQLLGADSATYQGRFTIRRGRISDAVISPEPASQELLAGKLTEFGLWLALNHAGLLGRLLPDGKLVPGRTDFGEILRLLRQWRGGSR